MTSNATATYLDHLYHPTTTLPITAVRPTSRRRSATTAAFSTMSKRGGNAGSGSPRPKFQCQLCASTFSRKDNLKTHQRLHSGEMPFQCKYCGRKFRWQSSARTHEQVHERHGHLPRPELSGGGASSTASAGSAAKSSPAPRVKVESVVHAYSPPQPQPLRYTTPATLPPPRTYTTTTSLGAPPPPLPPPSTSYTSPMGPPVYAPTAYAPPVVSNPLLYSTSAGAAGSTSSTTTTGTGSSGLQLPLYNPPSVTSTSNYVGTIPLHPPPLYTTTVQQPPPTRALHPLPTRALPPRQTGIRKPRSSSAAASAAAAGLLSLDFEDVIGDVGAALQTSITQESGSGQTPQQPHGESPMFNLPNMSQQDIEKCLEPQHPNAQPPTSQ